MILDKALRHGVSAVEDPGDVALTDMDILGVWRMWEIQSKVLAYYQIIGRTIQELIVSAQWSRGFVPRTRQS